MNLSDISKNTNLENVMLYFAAIVFFPIVIGLMLIKVVGGVADGLADGYTLGAKKRIINKSLRAGRRPPVGF